MKPWTYQPSSALQQSMAEQLTVFPRERDMTHTVLRLLWTSWLRGFLRVYFHLQLIGRERLPQAGSFVLVANHASHLDAVALSALVPLRSVHQAFAAAAKDYFFSSFWRSVFSAIFINAIPFDRQERKHDSLELCADLLDVSGRVLIMFPEGARSTTGEIQPFKKGIGVLTAGTQRLVVPAYIDGAHAAWPKGSRIPRPTRVRVVVGAPLHFHHVPQTEAGFLHVARAVEAAVRQLQQTNSQGVRGQRLKTVVARTLVRTIGQTSTGIRLCLTHGVTSGPALDYIYRNQPAGRWLIGSWIDRCFLGYPGCQAVRLRRRHLESLLLETMRASLADERTVSILDIASGPARYLIDVLEQLGDQRPVVCCRDVDGVSLREGAAEVKRRGLTNMRFERGDAFDREALLAIHPRPTIVIASGFYELVHDDALVRQSLATLFMVLEAGGTLLITTQMAHAAQAFASMVFNDYAHAPARMTMRPLRQIEAWLQQCGFIVDRSLTDIWGYYAVTRARKSSR